MAATRGTDHMATSKSRTKAAGVPAAAKKATKKQAAARKPAAKPAARAAAKAAAKAAAPPAAVQRKSRSRYPAAVEPELDEAEIESTGKKAAGKNLVIVESPTKSKTLTKFLGKDFIVLASNGHIMDLPKSQLGVDLDNDFAPVYEQIASKKAVIAKIRAAAKHASMIYLAPDPDREGEAIACHLAIVLQGTKRPIRRLTFNEITQRAVTEALEHSRELDLNLYNAQQGRRVLDRLVGYKVSPFVWSTIKYGLSAGRVQSVALRLICEREDLIRAFVAEEYWTVEVDYQTEAAERFTARLVRAGDEKLEKDRLTGPDAAARAAALAEELRVTPARVVGIEVKPKRETAKPPFITSTMQQVASNRLGFTSQRTMQVAQKLYEGIELKGQGSVGLITYMRTDSPRLSAEALTEIRDWLGKEFGPEYVPETPNVYRGKKSAQDAHEAIRPTAVERTPASLRSFLSDEQFKLYDLIWKRAVASQATPAVKDMTAVDIAAGRLGLRASGSVLRFPGWLKVYGRDEDDEAEEGRLPDLAKDERLALASEPVGDAELPLRPEQHFTQPPARYTDASLIKALEEESIGRPSTYATIVTTITKRDYVEREGRALKPTDLGMLVTRLLVDTFPDVFNVQFTALMEEELDEVEEGKREWSTVVRALWNPLSLDLEKAKGKTKQIKESLLEPTDITCPACGLHKLVKKFGRTGAFLACPGYPECKHTQPLDKSELPVPVEGTCATCGAGLVARNGPYGRYIHCERRPECKYTKPFTLGIACPQCGEGEIAEKRSRKGKTFFSCTRYPACDYALWDRPRPQPCPSCAAPFLVEKVSKTGVSLQCVKCKTRFPLEQASA
jgi:DNA topoisomerase-1